MISSDSVCLCVDKRENHQYQAEVSAASNVRTPRALVKGPLLWGSRKEEVRRDSEGAPERYAALARPHTASWGRPTKYDHIIPTVSRPTECTPIPRPSYQKSVSVKRENLLSQV